MVTQEKINYVLDDSEVLIIVPPFAGIDRPSLAAHILQACAKKEGFKTSVLYANIIFAAEIGEKEYESICYSPTSELLGERIFTSNTFNLPNGKDNDYYKKIINGELNEKKVEVIVKKVSNLISDAVVSKKYKIVGCTTSFEQTVASILMLNQVKDKNSNIVTIIGGANCEGEMAEGILSLNTKIDYIFSGEGEIVFPQFIKKIHEKKFPKSKILYGDICDDLNEIPIVNFEEYYRQLNEFLPNSITVSSGNIWLPYQTSRGCWWGEKHQCTFCGINGGALKFREKSPEKVINELRILLKAHISNKICMVDNIMPYDYFNTFLPMLEKELPNIHVFYEQKANLNLEQVYVLKKSGIKVIQPGIESLSTEMLKLMGKGVKASQNIALLRYAHSVGLSINWNILYGFPNDKIEYYKSILEIIPLITHLHPPSGLYHLSVDRFSAYFNNPDKYGLSNLKPLESYKEVFPDYSDKAKIAYHFIADYESQVNKNPEIIKRLENEINNWRNLWFGKKNISPILRITHLDEDNYLLTDTRDVSSKEFEFLNLKQVSILLTPTLIKNTDENDYIWALDRKLMIKLDLCYVPLVTANYNILKKFTRNINNKPQA